MTADRRRAASGPARADDAAWRPVRLRARHLLVRQVPGSLGPVSRASPAVLAGLPLPDVPRERDGAGGGSPRPPDPGGSRADVVRDGAERAGHAPASRRPLHDRGLLPDPPGVERGGGGTAAGASTPWEAPTCGSCPCRARTAGWPAIRGSAMHERGSRFRASLQAAFWDRRTLLDLLRPDESIWDFEREASATQRRGPRGPFYATWWLTLRYVNAVVAGRWTPVGRRVCRREALTVGWRPAGRHAPLASGHTAPLRLPGRPGSGRVARSKGPRSPAGPGLRLGTPIPRSVLRQPRARSRDSSRCRWTTAAQQRAVKRPAPAGGRADG